jgi:hypothetical protein
MKVFTGTHYRRIPGRFTTSEHLVATLKDGGTRTITLPGFQNAKLLASLAARTGLAIAPLPERKAG